MIVLVFIVLVSLHIVSQGDYTDLQSTGRLHCFPFSTLLLEFAPCYDECKVVSRSNFDLDFPDN